MSAPFNAPTARPPARPHASARPTPRSMSTAAIAPDSAMTDPTDRSMPPVAMTTVMPTDTSTTVETCSSTFHRFATVAKFGVSQLLTRTSASSAAAAAYVPPTPARRRRALSDIGLAGATGIVPIDSRSGRWFSDCAPVGHRVQQGVLGQVAALEARHVPAVPQDDDSRAALQNLVEL